jgi:drug/metabolite transporter (DMT)-like permease
LPQKTQYDLKVLMGCISVFASAFFFYLSTVVVKLASIHGMNIDAASFVSMRFLLGFVTVVVLMPVTKKKLVVKKKRYLVGRAAGNCIAVYCFFKGVDLTSVAQANILNMTYPLFIAIFSWMFLKEPKDLISYFIVLMAFVGVWLILSPDKMNFNTDSLWALASGVSAAIAIIYLNLSRRVHDTQTTLFFMFGIGLVLVTILFFDKISMPGPGEFKYLFPCAFFAIAGQYLLTIGFKYVSAIEGGIISSTRILLAALLGPYFVMEPFLSGSGWVGAFLILAGNIFLTVKKAKR